MDIKNNKKATSIVEAMVVLLIIVTGVTGMYNIYIKSMNMSEATTNKIQAIQIASQGIEAFTNIRDTNWLIFSSDYKNCWNSLNYNPSCIGNSTVTGKINNGSYIIYRDTNNRWLLTNKATGAYSNNTYKNNFKVGLDNGIYTQSGATQELKPLFTREIKVQYLDSGIYSSPRMKVDSIVQWSDSSSKQVHKVELNQILTNWKDN